MTGEPAGRPPALTTEAGDRWRELLSAWRIPTDVLANAPADPFRIPVELFGEGYQGCSPTATEAALEGCPRGGSVLDVGCAGGAASLPLAPPAAVLTGVDADEDMVALFERTCRARGVRGDARLGRWPEVAPRVEVHDVAVSHHVVYNVAAIERFLVELTAHARSRVVLEVTPLHPQAELNPLWLHFHHHVRPTAPTVDHLREVLASLGIDAQIAEGRRPPPPVTQPRDRVVAFARRRLGLDPSADPEVDRLLPADSVVPPPEVVCLWWEGAAPRGL